jgi:hypothetical protein
MSNIIIPTVSREFLRSLPDEVNYIKQAKGVIDKIIVEAQNSYNRPTRFIYREINHIYNGGKPFDVELFISILKKHMPDVSIEYKEQTLLSGQVEKGIVIDWS